MNNYYIPKTDGTKERISLTKHFKERLQERLPGVVFEQLFSKSFLLTKDNSYGYLKKKFIKSDDTELIWNKEYKCVIISIRRKFEPNNKVKEQPKWWNELMLRTVITLK